MIEEEVTYLSIEEITVLLKEQTTNKQIAINDSTMIVAEIIDPM